MTRKNKLMLNSVTSLINQIITIICGFILPRFFLMYYGSTVNGLVSSITQFLGFISLAECGVGAVVQSTLYKPLAENDMLSISKIVISSERFFRRLAYILLGYAAILMMVYPLKTIKTFDFLFTMMLIFVISISTFAQYYIGMTYKLLLAADQLGFIQYTIHAIALIINTLLSIVLMKNGASVQIVKLTTSLVFVIQPVLISFIAKRKYKLNRKITLLEEPIKQKWNGLAQHVAAVVLNNTDTVVLTLFSSLENVSIYSVYHLVVNGVKQIVLSTTNGTQAMFGNMLAKNQMEEVKSTFDSFEWLLHTLVTFIFSVTAILIVPFVEIYTAGVTDVNYSEKVFAYLLTLAQASYCIRLPYNTMVLAAGHYKQTQGSAIIEAVINVVLSVMFVIQFGLVGVAIGTFCAMFYRTCYLAWYISKNIIFRNLKYFALHGMVDILTVILIVFLTNFINKTVSDYWDWIILAIKCCSVAFVVVIGINLLIYRKEIMRYIHKKCIK